MSWPVKVAAVCASVRSTTGDQDSQAYLATVPSRSPTRFGVLHCHVPHEFGYYSTPYLDPTGTVRCSVARAHNSTAVQQYSSTTAQQHSSAVAPASSPQIASQGFARPQHSGPLGQSQRHLFARDLSKRLRRYSTWTAFRGAICTSCSHFPYHFVCRPLPAPTCRHRPRGD